MFKGSMKRPLRFVRLRQRSLPVQLFLCRNVARLLKKDLRTLATKKVAYQYVGNSLLRQPGPKNLTLSRMEQIYPANKVKVLPLDPTG